MDNFRRNCWLAGFLVTFGMLLSLRGMSLQELMDPDDVRYILAALTVLGILSVLVFLIFIKHYSSHEPKQKSTSQDPAEHSRPSGSVQAPEDDQTTPLLESVSTHNPNYGSISPSPTDARKVCIHLGNNRRYSRTLSYFLAKHSHTMALYIFGGGSIVLNLFKVFYVSQCLHFFSESGLGEKQDAYTFTDEQSRVIAAMLKIIFFAMEIPLLHYLTKVKSVKCKTLSRYILLPIMGANFAAWLYTFLDETKIIHLFNYHYPTKPYLQSISFACQNHSSVVEVYMRGSMLRIFYPIMMEFCIVSFEILHHVYIAPVCSAEPHTADTHIYTTQQQDEIIGAVQSLADSGANVRLVSFCEKAEEVEDTSVEKEDGVTLEVEMMVARTVEAKDTPSRFHKVLKYVLVVFHPCTALVLGITEASLMKISILHDEVRDYPYISDHYLYTVCKIPLLAFRLFANAIPLLFATSFCLHVIRSFKRSHQKVRGVNSSLILGLLGISIISIYTMAVCCLKIKRMQGQDDNILERKWMYSLSMIEWLLYIPQYFLQVLVIYHGQRNIAEPGHPFFKSLHSCLSYLAMNNFVHWGINSFLEADYLKHRNDLAQEIETWDLLVHLVLPTCIYFRFIGTFLLLEIKDLMKKEEIHTQEWKLVVKKRQ